MKVKQKHRVATAWTLRELAEAAVREGDSDLIDKIADERVATSVEELLAYLEEHNHPALTMDPIF